MWHIPWWVWVIMIVVFLIGGTLILINFDDDDW